jgi:D-alanine transfer protein
MTIKNYTIHIKRWFANLSLFHVLPIFISCCFGYFILLLFIKSETVSTEHTEIIKGEQKMFRGTLVSCSNGIQEEIELAGSLKNPETITIFGSSELNACAYSPYFFLPDSLNMPTVAFGHAFHQSFSMFCELLANQKNIKKTKICILISPGWFETEGTNIESFLEFVRPNFLNSIIQNKDISEDIKLKIGEYISKNYDLIEQPSNSICYFNELYKARNSKILTQILKKKNLVSENIDYSIKFAANLPAKAHTFDWEASRNRVQKQFISSIKSNSLFIIDEYYTNHLLDENKQYTPGNSADFDVSTNQELKDFALLIQLLKMNKCDASFVIQPLNPHHYNDLDKFSKIIHSVETLIKKNKYPCLNMFVTSKTDFEPGTLNDIMHLGDYGWININEFLVKTYE